jgi:hypothetical protein
VHAGIGYDILHEHPNCDGAAVGAASYRDFLIFARGVEHLEGGVMLSFGSAIMAPEVYLKALAMARNVAHQEGRVVKNFTTGVFDMVPIGGDIHREPVGQCLGDHTNVAGTGIECVVDLNHTVFAVVEDVRRMQGREGHHGQPLHRPGETAARRFLPAQRPGARRRIRHPTAVGGRAFDGAVLVRDVEAPGRMK